ncbi:hypothetical protein KEM55_007773, partial [Ascosphaera atra]
ASSSTSHATRQISSHSPFSSALFTRVKCGRKRARPPSSSSFFFSSFFLSLTPVLLFFSGEPEPPLFLLFSLLQGFELKSKST